MMLHPAVHEPQGPHQLIRKTLPGKHSNISEQAQVLLKAHQSLHDLPPSPPCPHLLLLLSPLFTLLQPQRAPGCFSNRPGTVLPQGLCTCCGLCLGHSSHFHPSGLNSNITSSKKPSFLTSSVTNGPLATSIHSILDPVFSREFFCSPFACFLPAYPTRL